MLYSITNWKISKQDGIDRAEEALVILEKDDDDQGFWSGWVPNFAGAIYPHNSIPGNGDLGGDVVWLRANTDSVGKTQDYVRVSHLAYDHYLALVLAIQGLTEEIRGLGQAIEDSQFIRQQLLIWTDLTDDEYTEVVEGQLSIDNLLTGARDRMKWAAWQKMNSAVGVIDSLNRLNPGATAVKHLGTEQLMQGRLERAQDGLANLVNRLPQAERFVSYIEWRSARLDDFLQPRAVLEPADLEEFYDIGRDSLKPLNQLINWLCLKIVEGGGQIGEPWVLDAARRALAFHRLYGRLVRILRVLSSLSLKRAEANSQRYADSFKDEVSRLPRLLNRWRGTIGGPYDPLIEQLFLDACAIEAGLMATNWDLVIKKAKVMRHNLVYRSSRINPVPYEWYGQTPPGSNPIDLVMAYNHAAQPIDSLQMPTDPLEGLPKGPRD